MQGPQAPVHPPPQAGQPGAAFAQFMNAQAAKAQGIAPGSVAHLQYFANPVAVPAQSGLAPPPEGLSKWVPTWRGCMAKEVAGGKKGTKKVVRPKATGERRAVASARAPAPSPEPSLSPSEASEDEAEG